MKKGRHRRFEEARALKRSDNVDFDNLLDDLHPDDGAEIKPEHEAWADMAETSVPDAWADLAEGQPGDEAESA